MLAVVRKDQALAKSFGLEVKAAGIGPKIGSGLGGGLRAAPAGMSFVDVTGVTDADTDGIVFEGKPGLERPIIPRFMVPKELARKLSGIVEGDAEAIEKQRRAGNTSVQFDEGKLRNIIASVGGDASLLQAVTNDRGVPATTTSGRERVSVAARNVAGNIGSRRREIASRRGMRSRSDYDSSLSRNGWTKNGDKWNKGNWELEVLVDENDRGNRLVARNKEIGETLEQERGPDVGALKHLNVFESILRGSDDSGFDDDGGMRSRSEWTPTRDGIEMDAPDIDGIYEIQGNNKEGFVVTRYSDGVRNGGRNQQEYEHDEIFKSRAAAKKWAERDYNDAVNAEQNEGRGMRSRSDDQTLKIERELREFLGTSEVRNVMDNGVETLSGSKRDRAKKIIDDVMRSREEELRGGNWQKRGDKWFNGNWEMELLSDESDTGVPLVARNINTGETLESSEEFSVLPFKNRLFNLIHKLWAADKENFGEWNGGRPELEYIEQYRTLDNADMSGMDLAGVDLSGKRMIGTNLAGANLEGANLSRSDMTRANLEGANLGRANLRRADLTNADFSDANLEGAILYRADVTGAKFNGADLSNSNLTDTDISEEQIRSANVLGAEYERNPDHLPGVKVTADSITDDEVTDFYDEIDDNGNKKEIIDEIFGSPDDEDLYEIGTSRDWGFVADFGPRGSERSYRPSEEDIEDEWYETNWDVLKENDHALVREYIAKQMNEENGMRSRSIKLRSDVTGAEEDIENEFDKWEKNFKKQYKNGRQAEYGLQDLLVELNEAVNESATNNDDYERLIDFIDSIAKFVRRDIEDLLGSRFNDVDDDEEFDDDDYDYDALASGERQGMRSRSGGMRARTLTDEQVTNITNRLNALESARESGDEEAQKELLKKMFQGKEYVKEGKRFLLGKEDWRYSADKEITDEDLNDFLRTRYISDAQDDLAESFSDRTGSYISGGDIPDWLEGDEIDSAPLYDRAIEILEEENDGTFEMPQTFEELAAILKSEDLLSHQIDEQIRFRKNKLKTNEKNLKWNEENGMRSRSGGMRSRRSESQERRKAISEIDDAISVTESLKQDREGGPAFYFTDGVEAAGDFTEALRYNGLFKYLNIESDSDSDSGYHVSLDLESMDDSELNDLIDIINDIINDGQEPEDYLKKIPTDDPRGMRSSTALRGRDFKRDANIRANHLGKDAKTWPRTARLQDVIYPERPHTGADDVERSDKIILSAPSENGGPEGKVYIAEFDDETGTLTVSWGRADSRNLQTKIYSGKTREDFHKLLRGKEQRGYRLEGGHIPAKYSTSLSYYGEDVDWKADHEKQAKMGMRSSTGTERRPHLNVRVTGSSALRQASFNEEKDELVVTYANGKTYTYENLSYDDLDEILSGPDRILTGAAINEVKKKYDFREGGTHTFDPQYQDVQGPGGEFSVENLSRIGRREKTQIPVSGSSAIEALTWDDDKKDLIVTYAGGRTYTYKDVDSYWIEDLERETGTGRIINNIKKEGYRVVDGGEHGEMPSEGLTAERAEFGMRSQSGVISGDRFLYQDDVSRVGRGGKTRVNIGNSQAVSAITWDDNNRDLIVTFGSGRTYTYLGVDDDLIKDLEENPDSVGKIINKIKNSRVPYEEGGDHAPLSTLSSEIQQQREMLGMRSRMAPSSGRIRAAEMEISARPQGMASRRSEGLRDPRYAVPGRDRVDPSDGQLWNRLSDEEKETVANRAVNREKMLLNEFKQRFPRWWDRASKEADKKGWDKDLMKGGNAGWLDELHRFVTKLADDPNYPEKSRTDAEKQFNDLQALFNMRVNRGSHDLLEHLNPTSRRYLFDDARRDDSKKTGISASGKEMKTPSTAPRPFGDPIDVGTPIREQVGQSQKKPLKERLDSYYKRMSDKILYTDPARQARREMRKARRQGINAGGFTESEANPVDDAKRKIRRRKRIKQMRKNRTRDINTLSDSSTNNRVDGRLAHTDSQGSLVFGDKLTSTLSTMMQNYRTEAKLKKTKGSVNKNRALAVLWDGAGYNGTPNIITPDEFKALHAAGWVPVVRGHGQGSNGVRYANDWIDDPVRFITGQGGEAQGEGEYWARATQGGGGWFSWMDGSLPAGTVGLLPPSTRRVTKAELRKVQSDHAPLAKAIKSFDVGLPTGEREKMDAEEYVGQLRDHLRTSLGSAYESTMSTKIGQMTSKILDSLSGSSDSKKQELLDSLEFLELISKKRTANAYAPLLGYDTIIADSGVELIHNRTAVAIVGDTFKRDDAVNLAKSKA